MRKIPTAIMMSGTGSNAIKIIEENSPNLDIRVIFTDKPTSKAKDIAKNFGIDYKVNSIYDYYGIKNSPDNLTKEDKVELRDINARRAYDTVTFNIFKKYGIELIAAAGYDWVMSEKLTVDNIIVNVHPGDLRKKGADGKPLYRGLAWIPTAKAILNGEEYAYTTTHLITSGLDEGPIARTSSPVLINLPRGYNKNNILPPRVTLKDISIDIDTNGGKIYGNHILYTHSKAVQIKLKERGDWVEFPLTMHLIAELMINGRFSRNDQSVLYLDGKTIPHGFLMNIGR